jgi:hypothetical protein
MEFPPYPIFRRLEKAALRLTDRLATVCLNSLFLALKGKDGTPQSLFRPETACFRRYQQISVVQLNKT